MPKQPSIQQTLSTVRPPRVQITYDVEVGDAITKKELPFVVGVVADLAGQATPAAPLKLRKFVEIDRDNFDQVLEKIGPKLQLDVPDRRGGKDGVLKVALSFAEMDDFRPEKLVRHIPELDALMTARQRLTDLLAKLDGNETLEKALREAAGARDAITQLRLPAGAADGNGAPHDGNADTSKTA